MRPRRLSRKAIPFTLVAVALPTVATCWLLLDLESTQDASFVTRTPVADPETPLVPPAAPISSRTPPVPPELVLARSSTTPDEPGALRRRVQSREADPGVRYTALRKLESQEGAAAVEEAEALVLTASNDAQGRFLAANALAVLARAPDGRAALERCASNAPTDDLRRAARTFLARLATTAHKR